MEKEGYGTFGDLMRSLMKPGETQEEFGKRVGINRNTIAKYLNTAFGAADTKSLIKISQACGVTTDWLLGLSPIKWRNDMDTTAIELVEEYVIEHLDKSDEEPEFETYIVWKCKTLQNWKYLISTSLSDGMYYELTYNGDKQEWYLDAYKKFENRVIKMK